MHVLSTICDASGYCIDSTTSAAAIIGAVIATVFALIFAVIFYILTALGLQRVFAKAGVSQPAVAWIPIYNYMLFAKLGDVSPWIALIAIVVAAIPGFNYVSWIITLAVTIAIVYRVNLKLAKEPVGWTIFGVILSFIWLLVIGFGRTEPWRTGEANGVPAPFWYKWGAFFVDSTSFGGVPNQGYAGPVASGATPSEPPAV